MYRTPTFSPHHLNPKLTYKSERSNLPTPLTPSQSTPDFSNIPSVGYTKFSSQPAKIAHDAGMSRAAGSDAIFEPIRRLHPSTWRIGSLTTLVFNVVLGSDAGNRKGDGAKECRDAKRSAFCMRWAWKRAGRGKLFLWEFGVPYCDRSNGNDWMVRCIHVHGHSKQVEMLSDRYSRTRSRHVCKSRETTGSGRLLRELSSAPPPSIYHILPPEWLAQRSP